MTSLEEIASAYPVGDLDLKKARRELQADANWQDLVVETLYRPFDRRWAYLSRTIMERPRLPFMENLVKPNVALAIGRAGHATGSSTWDVVFCTDRPADLNLFRRGGAMLFPRYVYTNGARQSNLECAGTDHDTLFGYIYAVLHSTIYRTRYADFLKADYPRIPVPHSQGLLNDLAELGSRLISLHLNPASAPLGPDQPREYSLTIGGYKVPRKYLEDRKHRKLSREETGWVRHIEAALAQTVVIQKRIDEIVRETPPWP